MSGCLKNAVRFYLYCHDVKKFIDRIESFTRGKIMLIVLWCLNYNNNRDIKSLFPLNDKVACQSFSNCGWQCYCNSRYLRETKRNSEVRWKEHESPAGKSETVRHLIKTLLTSLLGKYCRLHFHTSIQGKFWKRSLLH